MQEVNKLLLEASKKGEEEKVRALLEKGADLQARESDKVSIAHSTGNLICCHDQKSCYHIMYICSYINHVIYSILHFCSTTGAP